MARPWGTLAGTCRPASVICWREGAYDVTPAATGAASQQELIRHTRSGLACRLFRTFLSSTFSSCSYTKVASLLSQTSHPLTSLLPAPSTPTPQSVSSLAGASAGLGKAPARYYPPGGRYSDMSRGWCATGEGISPFPSAYKLPRKKTTRWEKCQQTEGRPCCLAQPAPVAGGFA